MKTPHEMAKELMNMPTPTPSAQEESFQDRVRPWMMECFGPEISSDKIERNHRFLEESLELVQACGCSEEEAHQLIGYVYNRPSGDRQQEVGGVMVTLAALCLANDLNMHQAGEVELARIWTKVEQIRAKQAAKPKHSPLPATPPAQEDEPVKSWKQVGEVINTFLSEYECYDGIEADHKPTEQELFLITDAVNGLLSDEAFKEAYGAWLSHRQSRAQEDESSELGRSTVPVDLAYLHSLEDDSKRLDKLREAAEALLRDYDEEYGDFSEPYATRFESLRVALEENK